MQREAKDHPNDETLQKDFAAQAGEFQDRASASSSAAVEKVSRSIADTIRLRRTQSTHSLKAPLAVILIHDAPTPGRAPGRTASGANLPSLPGEARRGDNEVRQFRLGSQLNLTRRRRIGR